MKTLRDTWLIFRRSMILTFRQPTWLIFGLMHPVLYLVLFGPLLEGAVTQAAAPRSAPTTGSCPGSSSSSPCSVRPSSASGSSPSSATASSSGCG